jgi:hypothetical protein
MKNKLDGVQRSTNPGAYFECLFQLVNYLSFKAVNQMLYASHSVAGRTINHMKELA